MKLAGKLIVAMLPLVCTHVVRTWFAYDHEKERRTVKKPTTTKNQGTAARTSPGEEFAR